MTEQESQSYSAMVGLYRIVAERGPEGWRTAVHDTRTQALAFETGYIEPTWLDAAHTGVDYALQELGRTDVPDVREFARSLPWEPE